MRITPVHLWILLVAFAGTGCETPIGPNPLQGWKDLGNAYSKGCPFSEPICADYQSYVQAHPVVRYSSDAIGTNFYEDGTGQKAVEINAPHDGVGWKYILIYDQHGKRTKLLKYASHRYRS